MDEIIDDHSYTGLASFAPIPLSVSSPAIRPEDRKLIKAQAVEAMHLKAQQQIDLLKRQAALIMEQARELEDRVLISQQIYEATMRFSPTMGMTYHIYKRHDGEVILSLVSPAEWGQRFPFKHFVATVKLLGDHTWDILQKGDPEADEITAK
ncbi:MAG: DUF2452 domain-containing protein [Bacteroidetes bacterium]|nr:DUF2452 domain-containing protein [Bacteroidota bacterium]